MRGIAVDRDKLSLQELPAEAPQQIVFLLDSQGCVLSLKARRDAVGFDGIEESVGAPVHEMLHSGCSGDCEFDNAWQHAWRQVDSQSIKEWEVRDQFLDKVLRVTLFALSSDSEDQPERRRRRAMLTIKDITAFRHQSESLAREKEQLLSRLQTRDFNLEQFRQELAQRREIHHRDKILLSESQQNLRSLAKQLSNAQEKERGRIALELHDSILQRLGAIKYRIETTSEQLKVTNNEREMRMLDETVEQIKDTAEELRRISSNLSPSQLVDYGVQAALRLLCEEFRTQFPDVDLSDEINVGDETLPDLVKIAIYRVVQEALHNISKYAHAGLVTVNLCHDSSGIALMITDDGCGFSTSDSFDRESAHAGSGLRNMRERVEATAGSFTIESESAEGTFISARWTDEVLRLLGSDEPVRNGVGGDGGDTV